MIRIEGERGAAFQPDEQPLFAARELAEHDARADVEVGAGIRRAAFEADHAADIPRIAAPPPASSTRCAPISSRSRALALLRPFAGPV